LEDLGRDFEYGDAVPNNGIEHGRASGAPAGISRRRLVQTAAWTTPAILIATAAPAYAVSGVDVNAGLPTTDRTTRLLASGLDITIPFRNDGSVNATALVVTVTLVPGTPGESSKINALATTSSAARNAGWSAPASGGSASVRTFAFTRLGGLAAGASSTLTFTVHASNNALQAPHQGGTITVAITSTTPASANNSGSSTTYV
jgi:hypothetical protein